MKNIKILIGASNVTEDNETIFFTEGLASCVGLALIGKSKKQVKRGLLHLHYSGGDSSEPEIGMAEEDLNTFLIKMSAPNIFLF